MKTDYNQKKQADWGKRRKQYLLGSLICLVATVALFYKRNDLVPKERLVNIGALTLKEKPSIDREPGKYGRNYLRLAFKEMRTPLKVSGTDYYCADRKELLENFNKGDTLQVWVDKIDFDNSSHFHGEKVYGLIVDQRNYCDINCRNKSFGDNQKIGSIVFGCMAIGCFISGLLSFKPRLKVSKYKTYDIEPLPVILILSLVITLISRLLI